MSDNNNGFYSTRDVDAGTSDYNAMLYVLRTILAKQHHIEVVRVVAVEAGRVDVTPMVNMLDGQNNAIPHGVVNDLPVWRQQAGVSAIILDPVVGDIGMALYADNDISSVKATKDAANPGSMRRSSRADGVYLGGLLNADPTQFIQMDADGIKIVSPTKITMDAPVIEFKAGESITATTPKFKVVGDTEFTGAAQFGSTIDAAGAITAPEVTGGGKKLSSHIHRAQGSTAPTSAPL